MRARSTLAALPAAVLIMSSIAHADDDRQSTAYIPARHYGIVSRTESLDGTERTVQQDEQITYGLQSTVLFSKDSAELSAQAREYLDDVATKIAKCHTARPVQINGYTDNLGSAEHGRTLSRARANAVLKVLQKDKRLATFRFTATGYGEKHPLGDNSDEMGRVKNRRVELVVTFG